MNGTIQLEQFSQKELKNFLINIHEKYWVELKNHLICLRHSGKPIRHSATLRVV